MLKRLKENELPFEEFVALALYDPDSGYYSAPKSGLDYATSVDLSPVFPFALSRFVLRFLAAAGDGVCSVVDIGCGDGSLLAGIRDNLPESVLSRVQLIGIDRSAGRLRPELASDPALHFAGSIEAIDPARPALVLSNELFDAFPFARLVRREEGLRELTVRAEGEELGWGERPAREEYVRYFASREIELEIGQFADISLEWERFYGELAGRIERGVILTIDYGFPQEKLFDIRVRRYGTAVAFHRHRLNRDLMANPGEQDLTAHINFTDLERGGEARGWRTAGFLRQARFLLENGAADHPLLAPRESVEPASAEGAVELAAMRDSARRLLLPDGIGDEMRVLIQTREIGLDEGPRTKSDF
ncbi:MAG: SAM-dependent methyltransferase [Thermoanaerobaculia bacterium]